jgi:riboflavin synthase alpha subunit
LSLIEHTWRHTTLGALAAGDRVHLEGDMMGKYARRLIAPHAEAVVHGILSATGPTGVKP